MSQELPAFVDEAIIEVESGAGGNGAVAFRREKYVPHGGPSGGNGGRGGDVILISDARLRTLLDFQFKRHFRAGRGGHGEGSKRTGAAGEDCLIAVPPGTVVYDDERSELIADLARAGATVVVARGGCAGRGNTQFKRASRQSPSFAERGEPGEHRRLRLVLKLLADVGIIGMPNVGKSTLIARISAARPRIADYPFTTLVPNLGVVRLDQDHTFVVADLPGLIEGAHRGAGLGHRFLRHAERTAVLLHVLDMAAVEGRDPITDLDIISKELLAFDETLATRPQLITANKMDLPDAHENFDRCRAQLKERGYEVFPISAATGEGLMPLLWRLAELVAARAAEVSEEETPVARTRQAIDETVSIMREAEHRWRVSGRPVERVVAMTDLSNDEAVGYLHRRLDRMGIIRMLVKQGVRPGDVVTVSDQEFTFEE